MVLALFCYLKHRKELQYVLTNLYASISDNHEKTVSLTKLNDIEPLKDRVIENSTWKGRQKVSGPT